MSTIRKLNPNVQIALAVAWCVLLAAAGWFLLVTPQKTKAAELQKQADDTQAQIDRNRQLALTPQHLERIRIADIFRLTKAMPNQEDMAGVILQLSRAADASGIRFTAITPTDQTVTPGFTQRKITIAFVGNFYGLSDFLFRLRNLVTVREGKLEATGRLFNIESLQFSEAPQLFPQIQATLDVDVYMYGAGPAPAVAPPASTDTSSTDTTATTTTSSDSSTPPPAGATAAGASG